MKIKFSCARCGQAYSRPRESAGRRVRCRVCALVQGVPNPDAAPTDPSVYDLAVVPDPVRPVRPALKPTPSRKEAQSWRDRFRDLAEEASHLRGLSVLLILLSAADLFTTFLLLRTSPRFYESNPIAQWIFQRWNIAGMAMFKFAVIGTAIALAEYIERRRAGWGRFVLLIGCVAAASVFWHGLRLYMGYDTMPSAEEV
jgi:Domain of unknown function (DUF5658)